MSVKTTVYYRWGRYNKTYSAVQSTIPVGSTVSTGIAAIGTTPTWSIDCRYWTSSSYPNITGGYFSTPGQFSNVPLYSSSPALFLLTMNMGNYYAFANTDYQSTSPVIYYARDGHTSCEFGTSSGMYTLNSRHNPIVKIEMAAAVGSFNQYVYSLSAGAYPNGSFSGNYYYQNRTESTLSSVEAPDMAFYNAAIVVSWSANTDAASYSLDRKVDGGSWEPVSGAQGLAETDFTDTAPAAGTALAYRVRVNLGGSDLAAESETVYLLSNDTLSISGTDGNLGSLSGDVTYAVSTDTGNPITVTETANGALLRTFAAASGEVNRVSVLDLPTGVGSIVVAATVATDSGQVAVTRTWQYTKQAHTWPSSGDVAQLAQGGRSLWPMTLAEAVRTTGGPWGGSLDKALRMLQQTALYNRTSEPKYQEVTVDLSEVKEGDVIRLPENGVMVEFYVASTNYEPGLNGNAADNLLLVRKDIGQIIYWDNYGTNNWRSSGIFSCGDIYKQTLSQEVQDAIASTRYYYTNIVDATSNAVVAGSSEIFVLSAAELGRSDSSANVEGSVLPTAELIRSVRYQGELTWQWTRSPKIDTTNIVFLINSAQSDILTYTFSNGSICGYRPCFRISKTFKQTYYVGLNGTVHYAQEHTAGGDFTDLLGDIIPTVKIATGSYTGSGTYGANAPNTLTFPFEPTLVLIFANGTDGLAGAIVYWGLFPAIALSTDFQHRSYELHDGSSGVTFVDPPSCYAKLEGTALSWYTPKSAIYQLNRNTTDYVFLAIG